MTQSIDLKEMEKKAFQSYYEDGIWDMFLGLIMISVFVTSNLFEGIDAKLVRYGLTGATYMGIALFLGFGKKYITLPRLGSVKFGEKRKTDRKKNVVVNVISLVVLVIAILAVRSFKNTPEALDAMERSHIWISIGLGGWVAFITILGAYFMDFPRLYVYGVMYGIGFTGTMLLDDPIVFVIVGVFILVPGIVIFSRFLRDHPLPKTDVGDA